MPSWKVHRTIGEIVCNFYDHEIDKLIDLTEGHDAGRYDSGVMKEQFEYVYKKWGAEGLCYYFLHHILDRLSDIVVSELQQLCEDYISVEEAYSKLYENSFKRLSNAVKEFAKTHDYIKDDVLASFFDYILATLKATWEGVLFFILLDTPEGKQPLIAKKVLNVMTVKSAAYKYKYGSGLDTRKAVNFLSEIGEVATKKSKNFSKLSHERVYELTRMYERIFPKLREALDKLKNCNCK